MIYNFICVPIDSYKRNYVVLCKQDLFGYNIIRRNRSKKKKMVLFCSNYAKNFDSTIRQGLVYGPGVSVFGFVV